MSMTDYTLEFEYVYRKIMEYETKLPDAVNF